MLTTLLAIITTIVLGCATGFGAYLWGRSDKVGSRLTVAAVVLMLTLLYLAQQRPTPLLPDLTSSLPTEITAR